MANNITHEKFDVGNFETDHIEKMKGKCGKRELDMLIQNTVITDRNRRRSVTEQRERYATLKEYHEALRVKALEVAAVLVQLKSCHG
jgi:hypothetical protein